MRLGGTAQRAAAQDNTLVRVGSGWRCLRRDARGRCRERAADLRRDPARRVPPLRAEENTESTSAVRSLLKIGEAAERVGLSLRTIRYYEEVGLVTPSERSPGGFRLFSEDDVARLRVLKGMKPFGLTLEEIRDLMALLDLTEDASQLADDERETARGSLAAYADRADARQAQLERHATEVGRLRDRICSQLEQLRVADH